MKVVSFIPIKLNNQRLPGKNTLPLGNKPMCNYIFDTVNQIKSIDERYVYCSDESIKKYMPKGLTCRNPQWRIERRGQMTLLTVVFGWISGKRT